MVVLLLGLWLLLGCDNIPTYGGDVPTPSNISDVGKEVEAGPSTRAGKLKFQNKIFLCVCLIFNL